MFNAEDVAVEAGDPLLALDGPFKVRRRAGIIETF
jgi:hypothetical protein